MKYFTLHTAMNYFPSHFVKYTPYEMFKAKFFATLRSMFYTTQVSFMLRCI
jgi:hypothetical protein